MTNVERLLIGIAELEMSENQQDSKKIKKELRKTISEIQSNKKTAEAIVREIMAELGSPESLIGFPYIIKGILTGSIQILKSKAAQIPHDIHQLHIAL